MPRRLDASRIHEIRSREAEYQAMWQACYRTTHKDGYMEGSIAMRRIMLREALTNLLEKRRQQGKRLCGTNIELTIERHLTRELQEPGPQPPSSPYHPAMLAAPIAAGNGAHTIINPPPELLYSSPARAHHEVPPLHGPMPVKLDMDPHPRNMQTIAPYPLSPASYPSMPDLKANPNAIFDESAAFRDEGSTLQRINELERRVVELGHMVSRLLLQLNPGLLMPPVSNAASAGDEHLANMSQADL